MGIKLNLTEEEKRALAKEIGIRYTREQSSIVWLIRQILFEFSERLQLKQTHLLSVRKASISRAQELSEADKEINLEEDKLVNYAIVSAPQNNQGLVLELTGSPEEQKVIFSKLEAIYKKITGKNAEKIIYENSNKLPEYLKSTFSSRAFPCTITYLRFNNIEQRKEFENLAKTLIKTENSENEQNTESKSEAPKLRLRG